MKEIELKAWILRGSQRRAIFQIIEDNLIPAQMYEKARKINSKVTRNNVSDILKEFRENKLIECINPEEKKGRIYKLTNKGKKLKQIIFK
ncbi:MAG: hypothetical protein ACOCQD_04700 [archaeon]